MAKTDDIILSKLQAQEIVKTNVYDQVERTLNSIISKKVDDGIAASPLGYFADANALKKENQAGAKAVLNEIYAGLLKSIPAEGISVAELERKINNIGDAIGRRDVNTLKLSATGTETLSDPEKLSSADLGTIKGVIHTSISENMLVAANVNIPKEPEAAPAVAVVAQPKKVAAPKKPKAKPADAPTNAAPAEQPAADDEPAAETPEEAALRKMKQDEEEKAEQQRRVAAARLALEEENKAKLASVGVSEGTQAVTAEADGQNNMLSGIMGFLFGKNNSAFAGGLTAWPKLFGNILGMFGINLNPAAKEQDQKEQNAVAFRHDIEAFTNELVSRKVNLAKDASPELQQELANAGANIEIDFSARKNRELDMLKDKVLGRIQGLADEELNGSGYDLSEMKQRYEKMVSEGFATLTFSASDIVVNGHTVNEGFASVTGGGDTKEVQQQNVAGTAPAATQNVGHS